LQGRFANVMRATPAVIGLVVVVVAAACGEPAGRTCYPGDYQACTCGGGAPGYQACDAAGDGYGACDCSGTPPWVADAATDDAATGGDCDARTLGFLCPCSPSGEACASGLVCFDFPAKGAACTKTCSTASDCPAPSPGCNNMGVCKSP
jgi:hypothetical protein